MREFQRKDYEARAFAVVICERCEGKFSLLPTEGLTWEQASTAVLASAAANGWYLGVLSGDRCPECVEKEGGITHLIITTPKHEDNPSRPHDLMFTTAMAEKTERERRSL